ncbi:hypothetical protein U9V99_004258 [Salmonella enterica subsp. enterica serovar Montevideo]|nr:hypothetical protein [Salmonella enterica subsp. enterica serovar Montevideo]
MKINTKIIMFDGSIKNVQDVVVGDLLMGPDSTPRRVLSLGRGREMMYEVTPVKGDSYTVNESHILSLRTTTGTRNKTWPDNTVFDIPLKDWLKLPEWLRGRNGLLKGWRTAVDFGRKEQDDVMLPPYLLGLWLGDGTTSEGAITSGNNEKEIRDYLEAYAARNGMKIRKDGITWHISYGNTGHKKQGFTDALKRAGVLNNKHIPHNYKCGDRQQRAELLAGLLDSDGYYCNGGFDWISVKEVLADDICYLARSLGFAAYKSTTRKQCVNTGAWGDYWRVSLSGDFSWLPFVRGRHLNIPPRKIAKNVLNVGIKSIEPVGVDDYYGFTIDGDHRFLLGDFTVTHNTGATMWSLNKMFQSGILEDWDQENWKGDRVLVLAPLRVASGTWPAEQTKWQFPALRVVDGTGSRQYREDVMLNDDANVVCCNYDILEWLVEFWGDRWPFTVIVADESTKLKSFRSRGGSKRARALSKVAHKKIKRFINLTGTPAPNGLKDLWGQCWFLDAGQRLGSSYQAFTDRWFVSIQEGSHHAAKSFKPRSGADTEIHQKIADISLTVDAAEYFGCDKPVVVPVVVPLPSKARKIYDQMEKELFAQLEAGEVEAANAAARTQKCLQIASGAVYTTGEDGEASRDWEPVHNAKLDALESIYEELNGAPLLVAYQYQHDRARILKKFPDAVALAKGQKGNRQIEAWNRGEIPMLLVHPASAGHGLNLQDGGCHLAFFSMTWNYEHYAQVIERIGPVRQMQAGHPRPVFVYQIQAEGTLDQVVQARVEGKADVQDLLMEYCKQKRGV